MPHSTHLLVANPNAQSGRNAARIERAIRAFRAHGIPVEYLSTVPNSKTISAVREAIDTHDVQCVVSMGGDGTLREIAQAIMDSNRQNEVTLGMLPAGTANNHGRSFGLDITDTGLEKNVAIIAGAHETRLDVGKLEMRDESGQTILSAIFIDSVGFGIGARVISRRETEKHRFENRPWLKKVYRDIRVYTAATLQELYRADTRDDFGVTMVADGQTHPYSQLTELLVKGTRVYAGSWVIDPESKHDDGLFEVMAFPDNRQWVLKGLVDVSLGKPLQNALERVRIGLPRPWRASRMSLQFQSAPKASWPAVQVDGEVFPRAKYVEIEVIPRALRLIVP